MDSIPMWFAPNEIIIVLSTLIVGLTFLWVSRAKRFFLSLPRALKSPEGTLQVDGKLLRHINGIHKNLIAAAKSKFLADRGPARLFENPEVANYIEKFVHVTFDDFEPEIVGGAVELHDENTKLFFELLEHKYGITNRSALRAILYLRAEVGYFNYHEAVARTRPQNYNQLLEHTIKYMLRNEKGRVSAFDIKRSAHVMGFEVPLGSVAAHLKRARKGIELELFEKNFLHSKRKNVVMPDPKFLMWEEFQKVGVVIGIDVTPANYVITPGDLARDSRVDRFVRNHLKYSVIEHFGACCAKCEGFTDLEIDHFWQAKAQGGNFAMRAKDGSFVTNCIPLCRVCHSAKVARGTHEFFDADVLKRLFIKSVEFIPLLNARLKNFAESDMAALESPGGRRAA